MNVSSALSAVAQSIVLVATSMHGSQIKTGTGFILSSNGSSSDILTAAHVVRDGTSTVAFLGGPQGREFAATVVRADPLRDIALIRIQAPNLPALQLSNGDTQSSGAAVEVFGFPTLTEHTSSKGQQEEIVALPDLKLVTAVGKLDGEMEQGESLLFNMPMTHGDSGAPVVDVTNGEVVAMVLGRAEGYGASAWTTGDGFGLSVGGIDGFIAQAIPAPTPTPSAPPQPADHVLMHATTYADVASTWDLLGASAAFTPDRGAPSQPDSCTDTNGRPLDNAIIDEDTLSGSAGVYEITFDVYDCSGAQIYHDDLENEGGEPLLNMARVVARTFVGYVDSHPREWTSLLKFGVAVGPRKNPYLALMSVELNPFRQLVVAHVFHGGPADLAGVEPGDAVEKIDGRPTSSLGTLFIERLLDEPEATLLLSRRDRTFIVKVHLRRFSDLTSSGPVPR
jgi:S1-C subfamily serine protease